jgi:flagellar biosynthesis/type III secretory pathway protein FliH
LSVAELKIRLAVPPRNVVRVSPNDPLPPLVSSRLSNYGQSSKRFSNPGEPAKNDAALAAQQEVLRQMAADKQFIESYLETVSEELRQFHEDRRSTLAEVQQNSIQVAISICEQLLYREIRDEKFEIAAMIRDVVKQLGDETPVSVRLNPRDLQVMKERLGGKPLFPDTDWAPRLEPDAEVPRGGCVVEGNSNSLVADPANRVSDIRVAILERIANARV